MTDMAAGPAPSEDLVLEGHVPEVIEGKERLTTRMTVTISLMVFFGLTVFAGFVGILIHQWGEAKEWLQIVLPVETTLLASVIGYYFGTQKRGT